jgi:hypothetical protein
MALILIEKNIVTLRPIQNEKLNLFSDKLNWRFKKMNIVTNLPSVFQLTYHKTL